MLASTSALRPVHAAFTPRASTRGGGAAAAAAAARGRHSGSNGNGCCALVRGWARENGVTATLSHAVSRRAVRAAPVAASASASDDGSDDGSDTDAATQQRIRRRVRRLPRNDNGDVDKVPSKSASPAAAAAAAPAASSPSSSASSPSFQEPADDAQVVFDMKELYGADYDPDSFADNDDDEDLEDNQGSASYDEDEDEDEENVAVIDFIAGLANPLAADPPGHKSGYVAIVGRPNAVGLYNVSAAETRSLRRRKRLAATPERTNAKTWFLNPLLSCKSEGQTGAIAARRRHKLY
jgi:hypothetical protein